VKARKTHYLYWLKTSRGTDIKMVFAFKLGTPLAEVREHHASWADRAMPPAADYAQHGFQRVTVPPRRKLLKVYNKACKVKNRANDRWKVLAAKLNPTDA
jgi:hypothetical protein